MIDYSPFWKTLEESNENWYTLTSKYHMSHSTLHRLKHNKDVPKHLMIYVESLIVISTILCSIYHLNQINRCRRRKLLYDLPRCNLPFPLSASRNIEKQQAIFA